MPRTFFKNWWWNKISPFRVESHFTPCYIFILNQSHIVSSRHGDISSVPKISLCSQRALNITESTLRTLLYLTFWELADICSNLYRGVIEIQRRRESCKEQGNCSEEYSVPHKQKPKQRARTSAGTGIHALIMREEASKSYGVLFCQGISYVIKRHSMLCRLGVLAEEKNHMCEAYTPSVVLGLEVWGQQIKRKEKWEQKWHLEWKPWQQRHGAGEAGIVASGLTARQRQWREHRLALTLMYARLSEGGGGLGEDLETNADEVWVHTGHLAVRSGFWPCPVCSRWSLLRNCDSQRTAPATEQSDSWATSKHRLMHRILSISIHPIIQSCFLSHGGRSSAPWSIKHPSPWMRVKPIGKDQIMHFQWRPSTGLAPAGGDPICDSRTLNIMNNVHA